MLLLLFEWGSFQILILMSGYIGKNELAAQVILYNVCFIFFALAYGLSLAASSLIGNSLGALNSK